ncbi:hypothetical protein L5515_018978 [Caenorhabditis briggsae]|uniref:Ubiquitin-like domain-containing protein n=1 Tax=Caenorhabditis briggsae TaxID=6238 RepID=A0AAE9JSK1_CAEBR|nr:hypothetical protein L5515_018978 [Caenorhabditis briggsae]
MTADDETLIFDAHTKKETIEEVNEKMFQLMIRSIKKDNFCIQLESDQVKVSEVRRLINEHLGMVDGDFWMNTNCRNLDDQKTLAEYNLKDFACVDVMFRMRGRPGHDCPGCQKSRRIVLVFIQDSTGTRHNFELESNDVTVSHLRECIDSYLLDQYTKYRLVGNFGIMQNDRTLSSYGIQREAYIYINSATPESAYETMFVSPQENTAVEAIRGARRVVKLTEKEWREQCREREEYQCRLERRQRRRDREENRRRAREFVDDEMPDELIPSLPAKRSKSSQHNDEGREESQQRMEEYVEDEMPDELVPPPAKKSKETHYYNKM